MKVIIHGVGATGARVARQFVSDSDVSAVGLIDSNTAVADEAALSLGKPSFVASIGALRLETRLERFQEVCDGTDLVVLTAPDDQLELAEAALRLGCHVVSVSDDVDTVRELLELDRLARKHDRTLVVGGGFSPGLTDILAKHASQWLDVVDEIHVAKFGTGGPACARQHHKALRSESLDWRNGEWDRRLGGSGRELCWFPDPVGGLDCYQGAMPDTALLLRAFPELVRATTRISATRRDQATKWLPMLRKPHPEGLIGAIRTEVRGWKDNVRSAVVLGALDRPAVAAGVTAAVLGRLAVEGELVRSGAGGVSELIPSTAPTLKRLAERGVKAAIFEGSLQNT